MKTKLSFFVVFLALSPVPFALSQTPEGFNYQAVARDASGTSIVNTPLPVRITIQSDSLGTTILWQELHQDVVTNNLGMINLVVGKGARQASSTVPLFNDIDWSVSPKFIKTEIDYSGWKTMGVTRLWSVPYSLVAEDLAGSVKRLTVTGETDNMEESLFEVKNKTGQTVFAVYNEGVRVYVSDGDAKGLKGGFAVGGFGTDKAESTKYMFIGKDSVRFYLDTNPLTKKLKGGFAVGGFDLTKGTVQNYLDVSADSVRIYIDSNPEEKKLKGGFAVGGYDLTKGITGDYFNVSGKSDAETINGEARVLWYPAKEAFRSGNVLIESKDSVGTNSWASGYQSKAIGNYSQALGYKAIARGGYSTAIGRNASALGQFSFAFGDSAVADGTGNYAYGSAEIDTVTGLSIPGTYTKAAGTNSIAFGLGAKTMNGSGNIAIGMASEASGDRFALAIGEKAKATNYRTISIGHWGAYGVPPTLMLYQKPNLASGSGSMAIGYGNTSSGNGTLTIGTGNTASESNSFAIGRINRTYGQSSFALGYHLYVYSYMATAIGRWNADNGTTNSWVSTDPLFMIGNGYQLGSSIIRRNAVTVLKSGAVGIGINTPGYTLDVNGEITSRTYNGLRIRGSSYSTIVRNDGSDFYLLVTAAGDPDGSWNNLRPFSFNLANGSTYLGGQTLTVIHGGNVGIGTTSPSYKLTVLGTAWCSSGTWTGSDIRWKENIFPITDALTGIKKLNPVSYNLKTSEFPQMGFEEGKQIGLIAQEVEKIYPELVRTDNQNYKSVSYEKLTVVLLEAVKEQQQEIESQQQQIDELRALVEKLVQK